MKFRIETWKVRDIIALYNSSNLDLTPPYQRNFIWSLQDQKILIESISKGYPIPNLFFREVQDGKFEVVDGQQRLRTIIGFIQGDFPDFLGNKFDVANSDALFDYQVSIIIIEEITNLDISIEEFYSLVNSSGVHLNRPEIKKAEYYETSFLKLINICNGYSKFQELGLFTDAVLRRMNDTDFVSELIVLLKDGITDKKERIDKIFEQDISSEDFTKLETSFKSVIDQIFELNKVYPIRKSRYRQRNDFFTLVNFLSKNQISTEFQKYVYQSLILFAPDIAPSNDECLPFQTYARNCVTQSNSKNARQERLQFMEDVFLNTDPSPNHNQREILSFYRMLDTGLHAIDNFYCIDLNTLRSLKANIPFNI